MTGRHAARLPSLAILLAAGVLLAPSAALAQRILGGGSDAVTLPRGAFRVGIGGESTVQRDRWNDNRLEGLGGSISSDAFGALQFSMLAGVEQRMAALGVAGFDASLGSTRLDARQRMFVTPLAIEYGLADWITLGARATLVRSKGEALFRIRTDSGRATLGVNPNYLGTGVGAQNNLISLAYGMASLNLASRRDDCQANAGSHPECATILAELAAVNALRDRTGEFFIALVDLYGNQLSRGSRYVPLAGSAADTAMRAHADSLRAALERYGVTDVTATTGLPLQAQVPLAAADLATLVTDSTSGYGARSLNDAGLTQIGDVYLNAMIRVHDSFARRGGSRFARGARGWRQAIVLEGRLGTGYRERADAFLDQGTGTGTSAVTVRSITDAVLSDRLWLTVALGYTKPFAKDRTVRVPTSETDEWLAWWNERTVPVTPGAQIDVEISPRWQLNDYIALGAQWRMRKKDADRHEWDEQLSHSFFGDYRLLGSLLDARTAAQEQRAGFTATYSTLAARQRGLRGLAFEIVYSHQQSIWNSAGVVPKQFEDRLMIRYYTRFFAR